MFEVLSRRALQAATALVLVFGLAACESAEERAAEHYENGLALLEEGDVDRAIVEFRNVFKLDPDNLEARRTFARVMRERGNMRNAYTSYLRLVEQLPDDAEGRIALAEMAFEARDWDEFDRHAAEAVRLAPDEPVAQALEVGLRYRQAVTEDDAAARREAVREAEALRETLPDNILLRQVRINSYVEEGEYDAALEEIDALLAEDPDNREVLDARLQILGRLGDLSAIEAQLKDMIARFPEDATPRTTLVRFYLSREDTDAAEEVLREAADPAAEDPADYTTLIQFLREVRDNEAVLTELDRGIAAREEAGLSPATFQALKAGLVFEEGDREEAIAQMQAILERAGETGSEEDGESGGAGASTETEILRLKVALARMQEDVGNDVAARRLVEEVLETDPSNTEALKMRARWLTASDNTDEAVAALRTALDGAPEDAEAMTLMAAAYTRAGSHELARDFLARAVEVSERAPAESLRYARLLMNEGRYDTAEETLIASLRLAPGTEELLVALGEIYVATEDWPRARQVVDTLRRVETDSADGAANGFEAEIVRSTEGMDAAVEYLDRLAVEGDLGARVALVRARLSAGDAEGALETLDAAMEEAPDNADLTLLRAALLAASGDLEGAEASYRAILEDTPESWQARLQLVQLLTVTGREDEAQALVDAGLEIAPEEPDLLWAKASYLEREGDIDAAIGIYERLYETQSNSPVVANNLASLLSTWREDEESLARAYAVARRLRGSEVPAFQETYGWILHRRGESEDALDYLEPAAEALSGDAIVQYHLGAAYRALGRDDEAVAQFQKAVEIAGEVDTRPQIAEAREEITRLQQSGDAAAGEPADGTADETTEP